MKTEKLDTEKLFEILTIVHRIKSTRWETVMQLVDCIKNGGVEIKKKEWSESYKNSRMDYYKLDLSKIDTWSTFDETCINLYFTNDTSPCNGHPNNQLVCEATIYDGNSFDADRIHPRFTATLWLPTAFIHTLEDRILGALDTFAEEAYFAHLEAQKVQWISKLKDSIILKHEFVQP